MNENCCISVERQSPSMGRGTFYRFRNDHRELIADGEEMMGGLSKH